MLAVRISNLRRMQTTVLWELLTAASGLALVLFVIAHLAGNFTLFGGAASYNAYSAHLHALGPLLWVARLGLIAAFLTHATLTVYLYLSNRRTSESRYSVTRRMGGTNAVKLTMIYSGLAVVAFIPLHLIDFAFRNKAGALGTMVTGPAGSVDLGLYGLVWNSFSSPGHVVFYLLCVWAVGLHLSNVISTIWVTLGVLTDAATPVANFAARAIGILIALGFSAIPIYVFALNHWRGV